MGVAEMPVTKVAKKASKKVARKVSASKVLRKGTVKPAADETTTPKKVVKKVTKKTRAVKVKNNAPAKRKPSAPSNSIDFTPGTDMATAFEEVLAGGESRADVSHRLADRWKDNKTRNGNDKPVSTILNHVIRRAKANGYEIVQTWKLVKSGESTLPTVQEAAAGIQTVPAKKTRKTSAERALAEKAGVVKKAPVKAAKKAVRKRTKA